MSNDFDSMINLMSDIEQGNDSAAIRAAIGGVNTSDVAGMQSAINALFEADSVSTVDNSTILDDNLDSEMSFSNASITVIESSNKTFSLYIGECLLIEGCSVKEGVTKVKTLLESNVGLDDVRVLRLLKNISIAKTASKKVLESKQKYQRFKSTDNKSGMNEQRVIYNEAKKQLEDSKKFLSE